MFLQQYLQFSDVLEFDSELWNTSLNTCLQSLIVDIAESGFRWPSQVFYWSNSGSLAIWRTIILLYGHYLASTCKYWILLQLILWKNCKGIKPSLWLLGFSLKCAFFLVKSCQSSTTFLSLSKLFVVLRQTVFVETLFTSHHLNVKWALINKKLTITTKF